MIRDPIADWKELSALYEQADPLDEAAFAAWRAGLHASARQHLPRLEQMLAARGKVASAQFLESLPALDPAHVAAVPACCEGAAVGPYRLLRHIGAGGMAEVWLADRADGAFERKVAIKLLFNQATRAQRDTFVERFRRERDILASLDHPNIARLHDAGVTPEGQPWLALEYVEGEPITAWCHRRGLGADARLRVFRAVLLGVEHAHANLVIHRDLKPSNILVTDAGRVVLLDFGISKILGVDGAALDDTALTRESGRPLTMLYASPEQLLGKPLTTACDVYSLGVVLYELLCGTSPYEAQDGSRFALERAILEIDPRPPSRRQLPAAASGESGSRGHSMAGLGRTRAADLDAIVQQALAKQPRLRYGSAEALRTDLDRWLASEPVLARAPTVLDRLARFTGKHRAGMAAGAAAICALLVLTAVAVTTGLQARAEARRSDAARAFMVDLFRRADPDRSHGATVTAKELLAAGAVQLATDLADQPLLRAELLGQVAAIQPQMGLHAEARAVHEQQVAALLSAHDDRALAIAYVDAATNAKRLGDIARASNLIASASRLADGFPRDDELAYRVHYTAGLISIGADDTAAARVHYGVALERAKAAWGEHHVSRVLALQGLASLAAEEGRIEESLAFLDRAVATARTVPNLPADERLNAEYWLLDARYSHGEYRRVFVDGRLLLKDCAASLGADNELAHRVRQTWVIAAMRLGRAAEASAEAPRLVHGIADSSSPERRAWTLMIASRFVQSAGLGATYPEVHPRLRALADQQGGDVLSASTSDWIQLTQAEIDMQNGEFAATRARVAKIAARPAVKGEPRIRAIARARLFMGLVADATGASKEAAGWFEAAATADADAFGADHPFTALARLYHARSLRRRGDADGARALVEQAWPKLVASYGDDAPAMGPLRRLQSEALPSVPLARVSAIHPPFMT